MQYCMDEATGITAAEVLEKDKELKRNRKIRTGLICLTFLLFLIGVLMEYFGISIWVITGWVLFDFGAGIGVITLVFSLCAKFYFPQ